MTCDPDLGFNGASPPGRMARIRPSPPMPVDSDQGVDHFGQSTIRCQHAAAPG